MNKFQLTEVLGLKCLLIQNLNLFKVNLLGILHTPIQLRIGRLLGELMYTYAALISELEFGIGILYWTWNLALEFVLELELVG